jgi:hypothetical protein
LQDLVLHDFLQETGASFRLGSDLSSNLAGRIHDTECELHIMEMFLRREIPPVHGASSL